MNRSLFIITTVHLSLPVLLKNAICVCVSVTGLLVGVVSFSLDAFVTLSFSLHSGDLIRLKVNEQVYSGSVDPGDQHIHLVPITKQQQKLDSVEQQQ